MTQLQLTSNSPLNTDPPVKVFQEFDEARSALCSILESDFSLLGEYSKFQRDLHDALRSAYSGARSLLREIALKRFSEAGASNISACDLADYLEDERLERGDPIVQSIRKIDLSAY